MLAMIVFPAAITLQTVHIPAPLLKVDQNSTPYGYTVSLLLFIVPIVVIAVWFLPSEGLHIPRKSFWRSLAILVPLGCLLDVIFAQWFFTYPGEARKVKRLLQFHPTSLILAMVLIAAACFYKKHFALPEDQAGFPGYFTVLVIGGLLPALTFFPVARRFINWRALSFTVFFMLLVSLLWEATLAVPYNWWNFQHDQMIGVFIGAWSRLPVEEIFVWIAVTYATVIVFEVMKVLIASERPVREALLGRD